MQVKVVEQCVSVNALDYGINTFLLLSHFLQLNGLNVTVKPCEVRLTKINGKKNYF